MASPAQVPGFNPNNPWMRPGAQPQAFEGQAFQAPTVQPYAYEQPAYQAPVAPQYTPLQYDNYPVAPAGHNAQPQYSIPPQTNSEQKSERKLPKWAVPVVAVIGTVAALGALKWGVTEAVSNISESKPDTTTSATQESIAQTTPQLDIENEDTRSYTHSEQLSVIMPFLEQHRQESLDALNAMPNRALPDPNKFTGAMRDAQIDLNDMAANIYTATSQDNETLVKNLLAGTYSPDSDALYSVGDQFAEAGSAMVERLGVDEVSDTFTSGVINAGDVHVAIPEGTPTRLIKAIDQNNMQVSNFYVMDIKSSDEKYETPVIVGAINYGKPGFVFDAKNWQPEPAS